MPKREHIKWALLVLLAILPVILTLASYGFIQVSAAPAPVPYQMDTYTSDAPRPYPNPCLGPYPSPNPYPGICIYLPAIFNQVSFRNLLELTLPLK